MTRGAALLAALALLGGCTDSAQDSPRAGPSFERYTYTNDAGTRTYKVYVPASYDGTPRPLVVELHGCGGNADEEARWSRFNALAEARNFLVVYPEQSREAHPGPCWNWYLAEHNKRGAGEPSIIAGITATVASTWAVDRSRIYVGGISAGGAMSVNMAVTYPDVYAAAMVYSACQYMGQATCFGLVSPVAPETAGQWAYEASPPELARVVPVIVIHGTADLVVPQRNGEIVVQQFLAMDDWADDGSNTGSIAREASSSSTGSKPGGHSWDVHSFTVKAGGSGYQTAEHWVIEGMGHSWSMGESNGSPRDVAFTDPRGPDLTTRIYDFFLSHPMPPDGSPGCYQQ